MAPRRRRNLARRFREHGCRPRPGRRIPRSCLDRVCRFLGSNSLGDIGDVPFFRGSSYFFDFGQYPRGVAGRLYLSKSFF